MKEIAELIALAAGYTIGLVVLFAISFGTVFGGLYLAGMRY